MADRVLEELCRDIDRLAIQSRMLSDEIGALAARVHSATLAPQAQPVAAIPAAPVAAIPATTVAAIPAATVAPIPAATVAPIPAAPALPAAARGLGELRLGQRGLLIGGLIILFLGIGYFLKYSFDRNWVGPVGRVLLAYGGGFALLAAGKAFRVRDLAAFGLALTGAGLAVCYLAGFAAFQLYELIPQLPAFALMVAVTAAAGTLAFLYDSRWLAVIGIVGGFVTPVLLSTGDGNQIGLMTYMVILNGGIVAIATARRWRLLNNLGLFFTWFLFSVWFYEHYTTEAFWPTLLFAQIFFLIHAMVPFVFYFRRSGNEPPSVPDFVPTIPNAFIALGYTHTLISELFPHQLVALFAVGYAVFFLAAARRLHRQNPRQDAAFALLWGTGAMFAVLAVPEMLSGRWITLLWSVQSLVLAWASLRLANHRMWRASLVLFGLTASKWLFYDVANDVSLETWLFTHGYVANLVERWVTAAVVLATPFCMAQLIKKNARPASEVERARPLAYAAFGIMLFFFLSLETNALFGEYAPQARLAAVSVLWTFFAIVLMVLGFTRRQPLLRRSALALFGLTVGKVFLFDMASVSTPYRILSFVVLGLVLVGASYLYHRFKDRLT